MRVSIYDSKLDKLREEVLRLIFSLASTLQVSPKRLATAFSKDNADRYAEKFGEELLKIDAKIADQTEKKLAGK